MSVRPRQHVLAGKLFAIVAPDDFGIATPRADLIEHAGQYSPADVVLGNNRDRFSGGIVDDHETLDDPTASNPVKDKIGRPNLIGCAGTKQRLTLRDGYLLASPTLDLQLQQRIQTLDSFVLDSFVIDEFARLPKLQIDHLRSISPITMSER